MPQFGWYGRVVLESEIDEDDHRATTRNRARFLLVLRRAQQNQQSVQFGIVVAGQKHVICADHVELEKFDLT